MDDGAPTWGLRDVADTLHIVGFFLKLMADDTETTAAIQRIADDLARMLA